jgi:dephospho-CoA kinase
MVLVGITGTDGAGKGTIVDYLVKFCGFIHLSVRDFLIIEIKRRGLPINRDSMRLVADDLRRTKSPDYLVRQILSSLPPGDSRYVIESIRAPAEVKFLRGEPHFWLISVDADPKLRYARVQSRGTNTDNVSYTKFIELDEKEMHNSDPAQGNKADCMAQADFKLTNNGTIAELDQQVSAILPKLI